MTHERPGAWEEPRPEGYETLADYEAALQGWYDSRERSETETPPDPTIGGRAEGVEMIDLILGILGGGGGLGHGIEVIELPGPSDEVFVPEGDEGTGPFLDEKPELDIAVEDAEKLYGVGYRAGVEAGRRVERECVGQGDCDSGSSPFVRGPGFRNCQGSDGGFNDQPGLVAFSVVHGGVCDENAD